MHTYTQLTEQERIQIGVLLQKGALQSEIADRLNRHPSTISRELKRNSLNGNYFAKTANLNAVQRKIEAAAIPRIDPDIWALVQSKLLLQWSPEQIAKRLEMEMNLFISHEWIYQKILEDRQDGGNLYQNLRWGRKKRKKRFSGRSRCGNIPNRVGIEQRPDEANQRSRVGDFEGDTVIGRNHKGKLLTLVDRKSRFTLIRKLEDKTAERVSQAMIQSIGSLEQPVHSVTLDNGLEFAHHTQVTLQTGVPTFFAHPYSSYERGTNENTNGLIRQYFPKKTNLLKIQKNQVKQVETLLNHRPRKTLGYRTPYEVHYDKKTQYFS